MSVVSVAITISFHLKHQPTEIEKRVALPLGLIFWVLSLACLASGLSNYIKTVTKYSQRQALVQTGWKTQVVSLIIRSVKTAALVTDARSTGLHCRRCCYRCCLCFVLEYECYELMT